MVFLLFFCYNFYDRSVFMIDIIKSAFSKLRTNFNKGFEYYLSIYLIINVLWLSIGVFLYNYFRFGYRDFSVSLILFMVINFLIIVYLKFFKKYKFEKIDIFLGLLILFGIIATVFAKNINISLYGYWKRYEGFLQLLYYYSLMCLATNISDDKYKKKIIKFIFSFSVINVFICFLQVYDVLRFVPIGKRNLQLGQGLMGNSNFFGSYMVLCMGISIGLFLYSKNGYIKSIISLLLCLLFFSGLLMSDALSGMVGLFIICLLILIYFIYLCVKRIDVKMNVIKHVILFFSCLVVFFILTCTNGTIIGKDIMNFSKETSEIAKGNTSDDFGSGRMFIWKNTIKVVPKYLLHGVGVDNFCNAFEYPLYRETSHGKITYFDKAHNEYLQKLICEGLLSCVTYIFMLFVIFVKAIKKNIKNPNYISIGLLFAFVGYSVQAFFNISVIEVAPLFWIMIGLLYDRNCKSLHN